MKKIFAYGILMASASLFFAACGDDIIDVNQYEGILTSESLESLKCNEENEGQLAFIKDSSKVFACFDGEWQNMNAANGLAGDNCSVKPLKKADGYKVVCGGDSVGVLLPGMDAEVPTCSAKSTKDGIEVSCGGKTIGVLENGERGKSCSVKDTTETKGKKRSGLAVLCGGKVSGVIWNGENGEQGESCYMDTVNSVGGVVKMICGEDTTTLYKAMCVDEPYDPETHFCYQDTVVERCGGKVYDIELSMCVDDTLYEKCFQVIRGNVSILDYDPHTEICVYNGYEGAHIENRYDKCENVINSASSYSPSKKVNEPFKSNEDTFDRLNYFCGIDYSGSEICEENQDCYQINEKCNGEEFFISTQFCYKGEVYFKCGDGDYKTYNPETEFCSNYDNEVLELCGGRGYDVETQFCYKDSIYNGCGDDGFDFYDPETQFCSDMNEVKDLCNGKKFSPSNNELCDNGVVKTVCFQEYDYAKEIDPTKQFCGNMNVYNIKDRCDDGQPVDGDYWYCKDSDGDGLTERQGGDY